MAPAKIAKFLSGGGLLLLALLLHLATCKWGAEDGRGPAPLISLKDRVVVDEEYARKAKVAHDLFNETNKEIEQLVGTDQSKVLTALRDPLIAAKHSLLVDRLHAYLEQGSEADVRGYGKFGLYARGSRDTALILGAVTPAIFLVGGLFMIVWAFAQNGKDSQESPEAG
jgi:hypothetical protein